MKNTTDRLTGIASLVIASLAALATGSIAEGAPALPLAGSSAASLSDHGSIVQSIAFRPSRIRRELQQDGWRSIVFVDRDLPIYIVRACRDSQRFELRLNRFAKILGRSNLGACGIARNDMADGGSSLSVRDVQRVLRGLGYRTISFLDRELPVYVADACLRRTLYRLRINRRGDINFREPAGRCGRDGARIEPVTLKLPQVRRILRGRGFNRVTFTDRNLPGYVAEACKNNRKIELGINGRGEVRSRRRIGKCSKVDGGKALSLEQLTETLRARRYYRIRYQDRQLPWYRATACRNRKEFSLLINRWGDITRRRQSGVCEAPQRNEIIAAVPRRRVDIEEIRTRKQIDADECQDYLESLLADNTINFSVASATIRQESFNLLERLALVTNRCPETSVEIAGHTDSDGPRENNQRLSERRAKSVVDFLTRRDVSQSRLSARGYGEDRPIAANTTSRGKARNRRIEFVVTWGK